MIASVNTALFYVQSIWLDVYGFCEAYVQRDHEWKHCFAQFYVQSVWLDVYGFCEAYAQHDRYWKHRFAQFYVQSIWLDVYGFVTHMHSVIASGNTALLNSMFSLYD
jgi:hypothetical protein